MNMNARAAIEMEQIRHIEARLSSQSMAGERTRMACPREIGSYRGPRQDDSLRGLLDRQSADDAGTAVKYSWEKRTSCMLPRGRSRCSTVRQR